MHFLLECLLSNQSFFFALQNLFELVSWLWMGPGKAACAEIEETIGKSGVCIPVELDQSNPESIVNLVDVVKAEYDQKITAMVTAARFWKNCVIACKYPEQIWSHNSLEKTGGCGVAGE